MASYALRWPTVTSEFLVAHTLVVFFSANYLQTKLILLPKLHSKATKKTALVLTILTQITFIYTIYVYWKASFNNPGYLPTDLKPPTDEKFNGHFDKFCKKCNGAWKPPRAYHCKTCNRCILKVRKEQH